MSDKPTARPRRKTAQKPAEAAAPEVVVNRQEPTLVETSTADTKVVASSLAEGGMKASASERLLSIGDTPVVVDTQALQDLVASLDASDDHSAWFAANRGPIRSIVFVPAQPRVLRATPLLSARPSAPSDITFSWIIPNHMPGVHAVVGGTGAGKSVALSKMDIDVVIRWGEPTEMYDLQEHTIPVGDLTEMLAVALVLSSAGYKVAVDSLRPLVFGLSGAAGAGGVSVALYGALTTINNLFSSLGLLIVVAVNPMSEEAKAKLVFENIAASIAGMTTVENGAVTASTARTSRGRVKTNGGVAQQSEPEVEYINPRKTSVDEPGGARTQLRLESGTIDVLDDDLDQGGRRGAKINL